MTKSGVTHTDTASGEGGGRLTENPAKPGKDGGIQPRDKQPAKGSGEAHRDAESREGSQD